MAGQGELCLRPHLASQQHEEQNFQVFVLTGCSPSSALLLKNEPSLSRPLGRSVLVCFVKERTEEWCSLEEPHFPRFPPSRSHCRKGAGPQVFSSQQEVCVGAGSPLGTLAIEGFEEPNQYLRMQPETHWSLQSPQGQLGAPVVPGRGWLPAVASTGSEGWAAPSQILHSGRSRLQSRVGPGSIYPQPHWAPLEPGLLA